MQYIYQILLPNEKSYIGITKDLKQRHSVGKLGPTFKQYAITHPIMYKDMLIYGKENVKVNILGTVEDRVEAEELEYYWITKLETTNHLKGYNHVASGYNRSVVLDPYYKSDEYERDLQNAISLIERYDGIRVSYQREYNRNNHYRYNTDPDNGERIKTRKQMRKQGLLTGYDTSNIDIERKKKRALETRALIDKATHEKFIASL